MAKISFTDKVTGGQAFAADHNEIKTVVNANDDLRAAAQADATQALADAAAAQSTADTALATATTADGKADSAQADIDALSVTIRTGVTPTNELTLSSYETVYEPQTGGNWNFTLAGSGNEPVAFALVILETPASFAIDSNWLPEGGSQPAADLTKRVELYLKKINNDVYYIISNNEIQGGDVTPPTVTSATINNGAPTELVVVFNEAVTVTNTTGLSFDGDLMATTIDSVASGSGTTTVTFNLGGTAPQAGDVANFVYGASNTVDDLAGNSLVAGQTSVTNNIGDVTAPTVSSAVIESANPDRLVVTFSEAVNITNVTGLSLDGDFAPPAAPVLQSAVTDAAGSTVTLTYDQALDETSVPTTSDLVVIGRFETNIAVSGSTVTFDVSPPFADTDSPTFSYTAGASPIRAAGGGAQAANLTNQAITNNQATARSFGFTKMVSLSTGDPEVFRSNGTSDGVIYDGLSFDPRQDWTFATWIKTDGVTSWGGLQLYDIATGDRAFSTHFRNSPHLGALMWDTSQRKRQFVPSGSLPSVVYDGNWHFIALTYEHSAVRLRAYMDGTEVAPATPTDDASFDPNALYSNVRLTLRGANSPTSVSFINTAFLLGTRLTKLQQDAWYNSGTIATDYRVAGVSPTWYANFESGYMADAISNQFIASANSDTIIENFV